MKEKACVGHSAEYCGHSTKRFCALAPFFLARQYFSPLQSKINYNDFNDIDHVVLWCIHSECLLLHYRVLSKWTVVAICNMPTKFSQFPPTKIDISMNNLCRNLRYAATFYYFDYFNLGIFMCEYQFVCLNLFLARKSWYFHMSLLAISNRLNNSCKKMGFDSSNFSIVLGFPKFFLPWFWIYHNFHLFSCA